jgi:coproporphyrinogen III oxidase-like Fe-S oxidoreductase
VDRTFNDLPERALDIWRFLLEQPGGTLFHFEMAPDRFTEDLFQFLEQVEPGRFQFELGIQSTNPQTLAAINRKCNLPKAAENIRRLAALRAPFSAAASG